MFADRTSRFLRSTCALGLFTLFLLLWAGPAIAAEAHVPHGEGRLWRIERGGAAPSHIMGTIHVTDPRVRDLPAPIRRAFESSDQAAFELLFHPEERSAITQGQQLPSKKSLAKLLGPETYRKVIAIAARYGLPEDTVNRMQPWALAVLFQTPPEEFRRRAGGDLILDRWLIQWAYDLGMRVVALETVDEQMSLFDSDEDVDQAEMLREVLAQLEEDPNALEGLIDEYLAGNMSSAYRRMEKMVREEADPEALHFKERFLDQRNHTMVRRMIPLLKRGRAFVAVGALHMPGEEGILNLLEQQGYRVTRIY